MADQKITALSELSVLDLADLAYVVDDPAGTPVSNKISQNRVGGLLNRGVCQGRLTTESGVPVSTSDRTAQGTIYFTPYNGNLLTVYDGTRWKLYAFSELSLALSVTSANNYDVFVYDNAGTLTLELSAAWTNATTRSDALTTQDGISVKSGATTRRWLGTIRASGSNVTADSGGGSTTQVGGQRFVWNAYNQVPRWMRVIDTTDSWSYTTATIRQADAATGNKVEYVCGVASAQIAAAIRANVGCNTNVSRAAKVGVGVDSTTTFSGLVPQLYTTATGISFNVGITAAWAGTPGLGYHYLSWNESGADGVCVFIGDNGGDGSQSGLEVVLLG